MLKCYLTSSKEEPSDLGGDGNKVSTQKGGFDIRKILTAGVIAFGAFVGVDLYGDIKLLDDAGMRLLRRSPSFRCLVNEIGDPQANTNAGLTVPETCPGQR